MMQEISLNILDVAQNSVSAKASLIRIVVRISTADDELYILIEDNGCGMTPQQVEQVEDPFFTTRTTRKVGLGIPFFKMAALATGGAFNIDSKVGVGTKVTALFKLSHIDRMPLGDITSTIHTLVVYNEDIDFLYEYIFDDRSFVLDTREMKQILDGVSFRTPEVSNYILDFLKENKAETDSGTIL